MCKRSDRATGCQQVSSGHGRQKGKLHVESVRVLTTGMGSEFCKSRAAFPLMAGQDPHISEVVPASFVQEHLQIDGWTGS